ncbi:hypothetical protein MTO96_030777, partial [Rhipicephalus appendiculatus]
MASCLTLSNALCTSSPAYVDGNGLKCSSAKSELFIAGKTTPAVKSALQIVVNREVVPQVQTIRVLGLFLEEKNSCRETLKRLESTSRQVTGLLRRITGRKFGLKEKEACKLIQAYFVCRIAYTCPFLQLRKIDIAKIDSLLRSVYRMATGLPTWASNERMMQLGLQNTVSEIIEAQRAAQWWRLSCTQQGHDILQLMNLPPLTGTTKRMKIAKEIRNKLIIQPLPKNMGEHNKERRRARADALWKTLADKPAAYVDASPIGGDKYAIAAVEGTGRVLSTEEITATSILEAEEAAIAMATAIEGTLFIVSDSMSAIRSFRSGQVSETAAKKLQEPAVSIRLLWVPSHEGNPGNEAAHLAARANTNRAEVRLHPANPEE